MTLIQSARITTNKNGKCMQGVGPSGTNPIIRCGKKCTEVVGDPGVPGRRIERIALCRSHGGLKRSMEAAHGIWWGLQAPACVGNDDDVLRAAYKSIDLELTYFIREDGDTYEILVRSRRADSTPTRLLHRGHVKDIERAEYKCFIDWLRLFTERLELVREARGGDLRWGMPYMNKDDLPRFEIKPEHTRQGRVLRMLSESLCH